VSGVRELALPVPTPFELGLVAFGHGWVDLAPHRWEDDALSTVIDLDGVAVDVTLWQSGRRLRVRLGSALDRARSERVLGALRRMLRLEEDFRPFWQLCRGHPELEWVARRGAGRLLRSASVFEDLAKLLMTTNCSWAATRNMVERLTAALGAASPSGGRAFPSPEVCANRSERFYREQVRMGYRAGAMRKLARDFARGALDDAHFTDATLSTDRLRERLLALPGFGPYAAGQALRLLGHYDDLALDSWCRAELRARSANGRCPSDRTIERRYRAFGRWRGLALWMDLTAPWHGESEHTARPVLVTERRSGKLEQP
jgi:N-glycosylase/DNA lyase